MTYNVIFQVYSMVIRYLYTTQSEGCVTFFASLPPFSPVPSFLPSFHSSFPPSSPPLVMFCLFELWVLPVPVASGQAFLHSGTLMCAKGPSTPSLTDFLRPKASRIHQDISCPALPGCPLWHVTYKTSHSQASHPSMSRPHFLLWQL